LLPELSDLFPEVFQLPVMLLPEPSYLILQVAVLLKEVAVPGFHVGKL